ncbi:MAG: carboxylesterase/lipase family protein [Microbacterium sp.]|uniref:carboxylesterase/lipase family protein n=1 Tax=Microbacterium sp. TaxID=51671 RepID=UPI001ACB295D|nr:carboxylesterase family protein [Microbacterium sp.]MBN9177123.1 carboxylesterase/lipase family protein [Microbacterium sp.]
MRADADFRPAVMTSKGAVRGTRRGGVDRYLGIPYALPPFGERRFALPQPVPAWTDVRDAAEHGPTAPQDPYFGALGALLGSVAIPGEDILTVNVWAPADAASSGAALPVFVWYHGGALERGTPALPAYDGTTFARDGIVFVSIGYRVGAEGFSVLEGAPRNLGLCDAAAGLVWVQTEIARFGGDPARITIVGESAGGALVAALLSRPDTATIPVAAIIQSGPLEAVAPVRAERVTRALAKALGIAATREGFAAVSPRVLLDARRRLAEGSTPLSGTPGYALALDPDTLPASPEVALRSVEIPLVIGTNTDEYRLWFTPEQLAGISSLKLTLARLATGVPRSAVRAYRSAFPGASPGEILGQIVTDRLLRAPAARVAAARTAPTHVYELAWPSPVRDLRAAHAIDIGFVFDRVEAPDSQTIVGPDAPRELAARMHADWIRVVQSGDPGWPRYGTGREVQLYDVPSRVTPLRRAEALDSLPG